METVHTLKKITPPGTIYCQEHIYSGQGTSHDTAFTLDHSKHPNGVRANEGLLEAIPVQRP